MGEIKGEVIFNPALKQPVFMKNGDLQSRVIVMD